ncbi:ribose-5-phosphate isomerase RpiA [Terrimonas pollutisoli]|uniref:ribose-5-phosphate isomerase RpiA n=1 Tax=Terrimonas pollutisoli TaxID=3034147 RepID=UPI0023ECCDE4|nr:ribose-5-phosphate isomerase RpiA [Terrimonas sp. H1YJ31]
MFTQEEIKKKLGGYAAGLVPANSTIGLGTGSTVFWLIKELADRIQQGLQIKVVPTSSSTKALALQHGIDIVELNDIDTLAITIDGADEVDRSFNMIKGGGGALLQEKLVAAASDKLIIIADESKWVNQVGRFPLPVEVMLIGWKQVKKKITAMGCSNIVLREKNNVPYVTDNGHYILDCHFEKINDAAALNIALHLLPGVVETGLFVNMADTIIIGHADGSIEVKEK